VEEVNPLGKLPRMMETFSRPESGLTCKLLSTYCALERVVERHLLLYRWPDFIRRTLKLKPLRETN
jgi:hypothetical protein